VVGTAINPTASACKHACQGTEMTKDEKNAIDVHGITCRSKDVFYDKDFRFEQQADAVRYAGIDVERPGLGCGNT